MKRYFMYLFFYSVGGFLLERIINVIFLGYWYDNSVLIGPYQPLYGNGVVATVLFVEFVYAKMKTSRYIKEISFMLVAILSTGLSEAITGYTFQWLTGIHLWDYGQTFTCNLQYICLLPTSLFGIISYLVVKFLHPKLKIFLDSTPTILASILAVIVTLDIVYTFSIIL